MILLIKSVWYSHLPWALLLARIFEPITRSKLVWTLKPVQILRNQSRFENQSEWWGISPIPENLSKPHEILSKSTNLHPNWYLTSILRPHFMLAVYWATKFHPNYHFYSILYHHFMLATCLYVVGSISCHYYILATLLRRIFLVWSIRYQLGISSGYLLLAIVLNWIYLFILHLTHLINPW